MPECTVKQESSTSSISARVPARRAREGSREQRAESRGEERACTGRKLVQVRGQQRGKVDPLETYDESNINPLRPLLHSTRTRIAAHCESTLPCQLWPTLVCCVLLSPCSNFPPAQAFSACSSCSKAAARGVSVSLACLKTTQHSSTAQHSTAQHSTAQHSSTACIKQHSTGVSQ